MFKINPDVVYALRSCKYNRGDLFVSPTYNSYTSFSPMLGLSLYFVAEGYPALIPVGTKF